MKILHTSDLHIGISLFGEDLLPFQEKLGEYILRSACDNGADCIIIAGDVFDSAVVSGEAVRCWDRLCSVLFSGERKIPVAVIAGNHDSAPRLSVCSDILENSGLHIRGSFRDFLRPVEVKDAQIYCIPYFNLSEARAFFPDREIRSVTDAFSALTDEIKAGWNEASKHIIAAHCFAAGADISESERASAGAVISAGGAQMVSADVFAGFDYAALGHLHRAQNIKCPSDKNTIVRYSGTPIPYSFSEAGQKKSFTLFDTDTGIATEIPVPEELCLVTVEDTYEGIMNRADELPDGAFVRIIITDRASAAGVYNSIKEKYPRALRIECAYVPEIRSGAVTERDVAEMSVTELAERYIRENFGRDMTDEMKDWLSQAAEEKEE